MLLSRRKNAAQNHDINIGNRGFENMAQFTYCGATVTDQNLVQEEIKRRLNSVMLATIQSKTFCLLVYCPKI
jgi:hypothetical protein